MTSHVCVWIKEEQSEKNVYFCETCGAVTFVSPSVDEELIETVQEKCKHIWECLRDRCHNRGKGKYMAYKCKLCGKFQRR